MSDSLLPLDRVTQISRTAHALWEDFIAYLPGYGGEHLLSPRYFTHADPTSQRAVPATPPTTPERLPRNKCATDFFNYSSQIMLGAPALVVNYRLDEGVPNLRGRATSWLWNIPHQDNSVFPVAMVDSDYLAEQDPSQLPRFWTRLLLHETGHLVLHWQALDAQRNRGEVPTATAAQEAEAWWFCSSVVGLALSSYAQSAKRNGNLGPSDTCHEDAWRFA